MSLFIIFMTAKQGNITTFYSVIIVIIHISSGIKSKQLTIENWQLTIPAGNIS